MITMYAVVLEVSGNSLLVRDNNTGMEVVVNTRCSCDFLQGDKISILYNGAMTLSIPPQIGAVRISKEPPDKCLLKNRE